MMRRPHSVRGFTLIEQLIVIAIIAILVDGVFRVYLITQRVERSATRQQAATRDLTVLEQSWRQDVHAAKSVADTLGDLRASTATLILASAAEGENEPGARAYNITPATAGGMNIERIRLAPDGRKLGSQLLARELKSASFEYDTGTSVVRMTVSARSGFDAYNATQEFTALAALGGGR